MYSLSLKYSAAVPQLGTKWVVQDSNEDVGVARENGREEVLEHPDTRKSLSQTDGVDGVDYPDGRGTPSEPIPIKGDEITYTVKCL